MDTPIEAIFENGVLRPLQPLDLYEHERVVITITPAEDSEAERAAALEAIREGLADAEAGRVEPLGPALKQLCEERGLQPPL